MKRKIIQLTAMGVFLMIGSSPIMSTKCNAMEKESLGDFAILPIELRVNILIQAIESGDLDQFYKLLFLVPDFSELMPIITNLKNPIISSRGLFLMAMAAKSVQMAANEESKKCIITETDFISDPLVKKMINDLGCGASAKQKARVYIEALEEKYPGVKQKQEQNIEEAHKKAKVFGDTYPLLLQKAADHPDIYFPAYLAYVDYLYQKEMYIECAEYVANMNPDKIKGVDGFLPLSLFGKVKKINPELALRVLRMTVVIEIRRSLEKDISSSNGPEDYIKKNLEVIEGLRDFVAKLSDQEEQEEMENFFIILEKEALDSLSRLNREQHNPDQK